MSLCASVSVCILYKQFCAERREEEEREGPEWRRGSGGEGVEGGMIIGFAYVYMRIMHSLFSKHERNRCLPAACTSRPIAAVSFLCLCTVISPSESNACHLQLQYNVPSYIELRVL